MIAHTTDAPHSAEAADDRAHRHRRAALEALPDVNPDTRAVVEALLALEARLDELAWHLPD